ncbi:D-2-hydroxyacid dehydrogenase [Virgibacillus kimchii]
MIASTTKNILDSHVKEVKKVCNEDIHIFSNIREIDYKAKQNIEILLTYGNDLNKSEIMNFPRLKWVQLLSAGIEELPFSTLKKKEIIITNAKGIHSIPMSEYVIGTMLYFEKNFTYFLKMQKNAVWKQKTVGELYGKKVLIFGTGAIGKEIAKKANLMGMHVDGVNTKGQTHPPFSQVFTLSESFTHIGNYSYIVIVLPLTPTTKGIFSERVLQKINKSAVLINIGRGEIIDEKYLYKILKEEKIRGAVLDVFQKEPLPEEHPFWGLENVLITPHVSSESDKYIDRCIKIFKENLIAYRGGAIKKLINRVDLNRYY